MAVTVGVGVPVEFTVTADVPPGAGAIVRVDWDFESTGTYPVQLRIDAPRSHLVSSVTHTFTEPGQYFAVVRVTAERNGDPDAVYGLVPNLARVRVTVES